MYKEFVPERLAKLRMQKGVSARDMSLSLGQANNYINNIENKKSLPAMQSFFYICEYLGITPQEFFDEGNVHPALLQEIIDENGKENVKDKENFIKENSFFISKIDRETYEKGNEEIEDDLPKEDIGVVCDKCKNYIPIDEIIHQLES